MKDKINKLLIKIFYKIFNCSRIWCVDISHKKLFTERSLEDYTFHVITSSDQMEQMKYELAQGRGDKYVDIIKERIKNGTYWCYAFIHKKTSTAAYTRWSCTDRFYSEQLRKELIFKKDEIFTLNSYTHPEHRKKGLHREMNIRMLNYLMQNTDYSKVYMVINCFIRHLTKIPRELGYKPIETKIYLRSIRLTSLSF
jgi:hypothetical protein